MRIKVTIDPETKQVRGFSCLPNSKATADKLSPNQRYVDGSLVPMSFYRDYLNFSLVGKKLIYDVAKKNYDPNES